MSENNISITVPDRQDTAITGSQFASTIMNLQMGPERESAVLDQFMAGNIPDFLHNLTEVTVLADGHRITYRVMPDALSIGTDDDFVRMPMNPLTAQSIANAYSCCLPTRKMVGNIWKESVIKLEPRPLGPPYDSTMSSTARLVQHNQLVQAGFVAAGGRPGMLVSGHKKDVVVTNQLNHPCRTVAIFGFVRQNGGAIQGLNATSHSVLYYDYSHGIRLINRNVLVDGQDMDMYDVLADPALCRLVSDEGIVLKPFYTA